MERPAWRIYAESMRMIWPCLVMIIRSESSFTDRMPDDLADARGGLHIDDALAAAGGEAVILERRALAEAVFGDREDQAFLFDDFDADQVVAFFELHAADAARRAAHGADVGFLEAAGHAFVRAEEDVVRRRWSGGRPAAHRLRRCPAR